MRFGPLRRERLPAVLRAMSLTGLRSALKAAGSPARAVQMQAYMKSALPYYGVASAPMRKLFREHLGGVTFASSADWQREVRAVWGGAKFREEKYAALFLCGHRAARPFQDASALPLYEELVVTGAWWDLVDELAGARLGKLLENDRKPVTKAMRAWSTSGNMWKQRASIICQLKLNAVMDAELLCDCIAPSIDSKEFFLRKAIGWALRQYARQDPAFVKRFVKQHEARLSGLSKREALKHL